MPPDATQLLNELLGIHTTKRERVAGLRKIVPTVERIYFDAERFRHYFASRDGRSLQSWRDEIDAEMRAAERAKA